MHEWVLVPCPILKWEGRKWGCIWELCDFSFCSICCYLFRALDSDCDPESVPSAAGRLAMLAFLGFWAVELDRKIPWFHLQNSICEFPMDVLMKFHWWDFMDKISCMKTWTLILLSTTPSFFHKARTCIFSFIYLHFFI